MIDCYTDLVGLSEEQNHSLCIYLVMNDCRDFETQGTISIPRL